MKRTTVVSADPDAPTRGSDADRRPERGSLKLFFSYAPMAGATTALLDEVQGMVARGKDVFLAEVVEPSTSKLRGQPFDLDAVLKRAPDLVALDDFAGLNPQGARNRYCYQDAMELLHAGIDVYAVLRVSNLENERDRATVISGNVPGAVVPDRLLYSAQQVEFIDIDPQELVDRCRTEGRPCDSLEVLRQLRSLALECFAFYASSTTEGAQASAGTGLSPRDRVAALVSTKEPPAPALLEATRLAGVGHAPLRAICLRREQRGRDAGQDDPEIEHLRKQVEALGFEFVTLWCSDPLETLRDYLRVQGVTDVVMTKTTIPRSRSLWGARSTVRSLQEALVSARIHLVPGETLAQRSRASFRGRPPLLEITRGQVVLTLVCVALGACLARLFAFLGLSGTDIFLVYMLAATVVAARTRSYLLSLLSVGLSLLFQVATMGAEITSTQGPGGYLSYVLMIALLTAVPLGMARVGRSAEQANRREQHTQALFELSRSLGYTHGVHDVVDVSLDALVRLFGRSAAIYVADPFEATDEGRRRGSEAMTVQVVPGDLVEDDFARVNELNIAHWVFGSGEAAGAQTDTNSTSDITYLPLTMEDSVIGVVAVSARKRLSPGEEDFLGLVVGRVIVALERQALAAGHRRDMQNLQVGDIRNSFIKGFVESSDLSAGTIAEMSRMIQSSRDDEAEYRTAVEQAMGLEASRTRIVLDRINDAVLSRPTNPSCDLRREAQAAVEAGQQGRGSTIIELDTTEDIPEVTADGAMLRMAVLLVLEASLLYAPVGGTVDVSVRRHADSVSVSIADDRPDALASPASAFSRTFEQDRAKSLLDYLSDRERVGAGEEGAQGLARALLVLPAACMAMGQVDIRRVGRVDRAQYGLYMAALIVRAHNGDIKMRHRLGGGAVTTLSIPTN